VSQPINQPFVLVVEDQDDLAEALALNLRRDGYRAEVARDGLHALHAVGQREPDLIILDLGLPRVDGMSVLQRIRADGVQCPVLVLTARGAAQDRVDGLHAGADDYVIKPFYTLELLARVKALLRRAATRPRSATSGTETSTAYSDDALATRFALTAQQARVARLLAEGLSNPEIAAALDISRFTARNHAREVLAKIGVPARARVAAALRAALESPRGTRE
jgi:DNA-binding response OmpR family regulator